MMVTIKAITSQNDFYIAKGNFLDEFYRSESNEVRMKMIEEKPIQNNLSNEEYIYLSAMVECLCNRYEIDIPNWVYNEYFFTLEEPFFASNITISVPGYQEFLKENSPNEFKKRNIFPGNKTLDRV